ncbi:MAG: amidohydrolase family protein [Acidimicrobiales bacterium]
MIDAHVHLLPGRLAVKVREFFVAVGVDDFAYPIDRPRVTEMILAEGITGVWNLPYVHKPGMAEELNRSSAAIAAEAAADFGLQVVAGASVHPRDDDPVAVVRTAVEHHGCGVLKLHCSVGDHQPTDPGLDGVWDYVEAVRLPVVVHAGHGVSGLTEADELGPVDEIARRHPEARIVIAHCGHRAVAAALDLVERHPFVHADLTPVLRALVDLPPPRAAAVAGKLLLGTDTPNTCLPATAVVDQVRGWGLAPDDQAAVLGGNAARLQADIVR